MNRIEEINQARGFLIPVYTDEFADPIGYGLTPQDFHKVQQGYACANCLADYGGIYRGKCPVCHEERDFERDFFDEPNYWKPDPNDPDRN